MSQKRILLVVNPRSGKGKIKNELLRVVEIFSSEGYAVEVYPTDSIGAATNKAATLKTDDYDLLVVCGGDGTLNEVITGLMTAKADIPIGYIPSGTLNEWSTGLGISKNIKQAAKDILTGKVQDLDIGRFDNRYFSYTASFGAFTEASYSAPQDVKNVLGQAAYVFEGVKSLGNIKPIHLKFVADGREIEGDFLFGAISNSMSVGGIVKFDSNEVALNDGYFEVLLIRNPDNILKLQPMIDGIIRKELNREGMEFFKTKEITVYAENEISWTLDGEYAAGKDIIRISNIHKAVRFVVP